MVIGFVLVATELAKKIKVYKELSHQKSELAKVRYIYALCGEQRLALPETLLNYPICGEYDFIVEVDAQPGKLGEYVITAIRTIPGVIETKTLSGEKPSMEEILKRSEQSANPLSPQQTPARQSQ